MSVAPRQRTSTLLLAAAALRIGLLVYGVRHDARHALKYTDVDYAVFSDAARYVLAPDPPQRAEGPLAPSWLGSPYARETYRYTPLLALALVPNAVHPAFGKMLFALADLGVGALLLRPSLGATRLSVAAIWLLNPLVAVISTRGNAEAIIGVAVVYALELARRRRWDASAVALGVAAHLKLYPVVYGAAVLAALAKRPLRAVRYSVVCFASFMSLNVAMYILCVRASGSALTLQLGPAVRRAHLPLPRPPRRPPTQLLALLLPALPRLGRRERVVGDRAALQLRAADRARRADRIRARRARPARRMVRADGRLRHVQQGLHVAGALAAQWPELTRQYFMWYLWLLPPALSAWRASSTERLLIGGAWIGAQALWLSVAYRLEIEGEPVYLELWLASIVFLAVNAWALARYLGGLRRDDATKGRGHDGPTSMGSTGLAGVEADVGRGDVAGAYAGR